MPVPSTLDRYFARRFLLWLAPSALALMFLFGLVDLIELLRRAAGKDDISAAILAQMSLLKLPWLARESFPIIVLFAALGTLWSLARRWEHTAARAAGVSVGRILGPMMAVAALLGVAQIVAYNPASTLLHRQYERLEARHLSRAEPNQAIGASGVWLQQRHAGARTVLHGRAAQLDRRRLERVSAFLYDADGRFHTRIEAEAVVLRAGAWEFQNGRLTDVAGHATPFDRHELPTSLTIDKIREGLAATRPASLWAMPAFIDTLERAGFDIRGHRVSFHAQLSTPLILSGIVLLAPLFTFRAGRRAGAGWLVTGGILCGFGLYLFTDIVRALGVSTNMPAAVAGWMPSLVTMLVGMAALLHAEQR